MIAGGPTWLTDGFWNQLGGMDGSKSPDLIGPNYYALGVNTTARGGKPKTRPGWKQVVFTSPEAVFPNISDAPFNGASSYYDAAGAFSEIIIVAGGRVIRATPHTKTLEDITPDAGFDFYAPCWMVQAERFFIIQNGIDIPYIYDGKTVRRSRTGALNPNIAVTSLTQTGGLATCTTTDPHGFVSGDYVQIEGATPDLYNGEYTILVTSPTVFTFVCDSTLASPATGTVVTRYAPEVPVGTTMAFGQGRLFVAGVDRTTFRAGDIIYGDLAGTDANLLRFTENQYLAEGGDFALPTTMGRVTAMVFVPFQDSSTGQGELLVMGDYGVASFAVSTPRNEWKNSQIQKITFNSVGAVSPDGHTFANNDVFFRTTDGIQSYRQARADLNSFGQTLVSSEVARILDQDDKRLLGGVSATSHDNRIFFTCAPTALPRRLQVAEITRSGGTANIKTVWPHELAEDDSVTLSGTDGYDGEHIVTSVGSDFEFTISVTSGGDESGGDMFVTIPHLPSPTAYRGIVSLDFRALAMIGDRDAAAYDGVWTGGNIRKILNGRADGEPTLYVIRADSASSTSVWEVLPQWTPDEDLSSTVRQRCVIETRAFSFEKPFTLKKLARADLWISEIRGKVDFRIFYRADGYPCWVPWHEFSYCATVDEEIPETDPTSPTTPRALPQFRVQRRLPAPADECDPATKKLFRIGYSFQFRIEWSGVCQLDKFLAHAMELPEQLGGNCA